MLKILNVTGRTSKYYNNYLASTALANFICGTESVLSSYSMLDASGVGKEYVPLATVSLNLIGKDIVGQIISVPVTIRASKMGDKDPIKYTKFNVMIFELSNLLEYLTPLFSPNYFIFLAATGNVGKNIGFTGFSSFNANAINKLSIDKDNISELYSKITAVVSISYSLGMGFGLFLVNIVPCYYTRLCLLPFLGICRYFALVRSFHGLNEKDTIKN